MKANNTVADFYNAMDAIAPFNIVGDWDNVGVLVGAPSDSVSKVLLALDATYEVIKEAIELEADLIITHHPLIFDPLSSLSSQSLVYKLAKHGIALLAAHTNLDMTQGGVNDQLAKCLGVENSAVISPSEVFPAQYGYASMGELSAPMPAREFVKHVKAVLDAPGVMFSTTEREVKKVAYCGGSGGKFLPDAILAGADAYVTGEIDHHLILEAHRASITLVIAGHFHTETIIMEPLREMLLEKLPEFEHNIIVSKRCTDNIEFM